MARRYSSITFAAAVSTLAFAVATQEAQAAAYAFSTIQISNFAITSSAALNVTVPGLLGETPSANLNGVPAPVAPDALAPPSQAGTIQACIGDCTAVSMNPFVEVTPPLSTGSFAQAADFANNNVAPSTSDTAAQVQVVGAATGNGSAENQQVVGFQFVLVTSPPTTSAAATVSFDALTNLIEGVTAPGVSAKTNDQFTIEIDCNQVGGCGGGTTDGEALVVWSPNSSPSGAIGGTATNPSNVDLNFASVSQVGPGTKSYSASGALSLTSVLPTNTDLTFNITQVNGAQATSIPEPMSLALFGTGLLGLGVFARRRRRQA